MNEKQKALGMVVDAALTGHELHYARVDNGNIMLYSRDMRRRDSAIWIARIKGDIFDPRNPKPLRFFEPIAYSTAIEMIKKGFINLPKREPSRSPHKPSIKA